VQGEAPAWPLGDLGDLGGSNNRRCAPDEGPSAAIQRAEALLDSTAKLAKKAKATDGKTGR
jgi:hypothetical protein